MAQRDLVTLVDISRSSEDLTFETTMYRKQYDRLNAAGKLRNWRLKSDIDSIRTETLNHHVDAEHEVVIEQAASTPVEAEESELNFELMDLEELRAFAKDEGVKHHPASKEKGIIKALKKAGY